MKNYIFLSALLFIISAGYDKNVEGYIVLPSNDTLHVHLKIASGLFGGYDMNKKIKVADSSGAIVTYTPADLAAYGYTENEKEYLYRSKPIKDSTLYFLKVVATGPKASLYAYYVTVGYGNSSSTKELYTFERPDGAWLFLKNYDMLTTLRDKIKAFYGDTPALQEFIDKKFNRRGKIQDDILAILEELNKSSGQN